MKPDFSDIKLNSAVKQTAATSENQDVWNTPEAIPVKKQFTKEQKIEIGNLSEGMYIFKINNETERTFRIIKN